MKLFDRVLDFIGMAAAGVVVTAASGVAMPAWLVIASAILAYASGKAAAPGVPMMSKRPPAGPTP